MIMIVGVIANDKIIWILINEANKDNYGLSCNNKNKINTNVDINDDQISEQKKFTFGMTYVFQICNIKFWIQ